MLAQAESARTTEEAVIGRFNGLIGTYLGKFAANNNGVVAAIVDTTESFNKAIANPEKYGAPNATCYKEDGVSCLWFNDYHPGIAINKLVAAAVAEAVDDLSGAPMC
jgi:phospholipase/lecithinase/hemolysin